jgi:hypothetical protein
VSFREAGLALLRWLSESPTTPAVPDHTIVVALVYVIGGGVFTILGTFIATRASRHIRRDRLDEGIEDHEESPELHDAYRRTLDELQTTRGERDALRIFVSRLGYAPLRIRTGWENPQHVVPRQQRPPAQPRTPSG